MTLQFSEAVRNARLNAVESTIGTAPKLRLITGAMPENCAAAQTGTQLSEMSLPSDWLSAAALGVKEKRGTWTGTASAAGDIGYYRIMNTAGTVCHEQGSVTPVGGGGAITVSNISVTVGQTITILTKKLTDGNA